jgi:hypothetical protein
MHVEEVCEITEEEFEGYRTAIAAYRRLTERTTYILLQRNKHELVATLAACSNVERMSGNFRLLDKQVLSVTLINELLNWLAAGMLYVENNASYFRSYFGERSDELRSFWVAKSRAGQSIGFRFAEALRDYAQHAAPPLSGLEVSRADAQPRRVDIYVLKSELLTAPDFEWGARRRKLIEALPEQIPVMPFVVEAMDGYRLIENAVLRILLHTATAAIPKLRDGIEKVAPQPDQHPCILRFRDRDDGVKGTNFIQVSFPNRDDLDLLESAAVTSDPLGALRGRIAVAPSKSPDMTEANQQAASIISIWTEHGGYSTELQEALNMALAGDGARTVVPGLVNLCSYLAAMVSTLIGSTPQSLIGSFIMDADPPEDPAPSP